MKSILERVVSRRWAALLAVGFCGYLTLATSRSMPVTCPAEEATSVSRTFAPGEQSSQWTVTAVSATTLSSWHIQVTPAVSLTYVPPEGVDVMVVIDDGTAEPKADAGPTGDGGAGPSAASGSSEGALPPDHVLVGDGTLTVVCGGDPSLCDSVRFAVALAESDAKAFTLEATALRSNCASSGEITDLRLEPAGP